MTELRAYRIHYHSRDQGRTSQVDVLAYDMTEARQRFEAHAALCTVWDSGKFVPLNRVLDIEPLPESYESLMENRKFRFAGEAAERSKTDGI